MASITIDGVEIPTIDINDQDVRPMPLTVAGASDDAEIWIAFTKVDVEPTDDDYVQVDWTDDTFTAVSLLFGYDGGISLTTLGTGIFYPRVKVIDGDEVTRESGAVPLVISQVGISVI